MHPVAWLRSHPRAADALLAGGLAVLSVIGDATVEASDGVDPAPLWVSIPLSAASCAVLYWRRTRPTMVMWIVTALGVATAALNVNAWSSGIAVLFALYAIAAYGHRHHSLRALWATMVAIAFIWTNFVLRNDVDVEAVDLISNYVIFVTAWVVGDSVRTRRAYVAGLEERTAALERQRTEEAQQAVTVERNRIARELHDVVAHHVSVMVVQAGAARRVLATRPDQATEALASVEAVGRQALDELRRILGVMRSVPLAGAAESRSPQPGLALVDTLVSQVREAGLPVEVEVVGDVRPLPVAVDLSAYRIVQEALTNTLKHAGPAQARVTLRYGDDDVELEVVDDGRGASADGAGGHGLVGMRERVELFGGELKAGPRSGGGFSVRARLPVA